MVFRATPSRRGNNHLNDYLRLRLRAKRVLKSISTPLNATEMIIHSLKALISVGIFKVQITRF